MLDTCPYCGRELLKRRLNIYPSDGKSMIIFECLSCCSKYVEKSELSKLGDIST